MSEATGGDLERSARYHHIHVPNHLGDAVRVLFRASEATFVGVGTPRADRRVLGSEARIWPSTADAGGGTRTPDTRIMIPLL